MKVKIKKPVTFRNGVNGELTSYRDGAIVTVADETGAAWISEGLAEEYTLVTPTGTKTITENGEGINVAGYAAADVNVPSVQPTGTLNVTQNGTYNVTDKASAVVNVIPWVIMLYAGSGFFESAPYGDLPNQLSIPFVAGTTFEDLSDLPVPTYDGGEPDYVFLGWSTDLEGEPEEPDVVFPFTPSENFKGLLAVYGTDA